MAKRKAPYLLLSVASGVVLAPACGSDSTSVAMGSVAYPCDAGRCPDGSGGTGGSGGMHTDAGVIVRPPGTGGRRIIGVVPVPPGAGGMQFPGVIIRPPDGGK